MVLHDLGSFDGWKPLDVEVLVRPVEAVVVDVPGDGDHSVVVSRAEVGFTRGSKCLSLKK